MDGGGGSKFGQLGRCLGGWERYVWSSSGYGYLCILILNKKKLPAYQVVADLEAQKETMHYWDY